MCRDGRDARGNVVAESERERRRQVIRDCYNDESVHDPARKAARILHLSEPTVFGIARAMEVDGEVLNRRKRRKHTRYQTLSGFRREVAQAVFAPDATVESIREAWQAACEHCADARYDRYGH